jgi:uncharacterized 2Fe-2S/4Fe-4S cluster protein (DUF4445 family)
MKTHPLTIHLPDGSISTIEPTLADAETSLADFLEQHDYGLNTRCGGRGLCRGCEVTCTTSDGSETFRSCQTPLSTLPDAPLSIEIPNGSWHNQTLYGVSFFDIRLPILPEARITRQSLVLAVDIGTTTLAGALWDLSSGQCLAHASIANPQRKYGDNVLSRISFSIDHTNGMEKLQRTLIDEGLNPLIRTLARQADRPAKSIEAATLAGNPVMLHTLLGFSLKGLSTYPFKPEFLSARSLSSSEIGLQPELTLQLLPSLGPFVGADIVAGALASGTLAAKGSILLIDFGTNGEILLKHEGRYFATATAAGPAFEGGRLSCGASARAGVISSLERSEAGWSYNLCEGSATTPTGISGAAYIDFLAIGLDCGLLNPFGRFDRSHPDVTTHRVDDEIEHIVRLSPELWISEPDVAEILQAKAAIGAGVLVLLELAGIAADDLETVFVAGGFGYHLHPDHAIAIGLLPPVPRKRVEVIGNAALGGASLSLQADFSQQIKSLIENCQIVELNQVPSFSDYYTDALLLEEIE